MDTVMLHLQLRSCYKFYMGHKTKKNYLGVLNYEKTPLIIHCHCNWIHTLFTSIDFLSNSNIIIIPRRFQSATIQCQRVPFRQLLKA